MKTRVDPMRRSDSDSRTDSAPHSLPNEQLLDHLPPEKTSGGSGLGDLVENALEKVGIKQVSDKIHAWLGIPCGCQERKQKLNQLSRWASRILTGKTERAEEYLDSITES